MRQAVGGDVMGALQTLTDLLYESVDEAIGANERCFADLQALLRVAFPKRHILEREVNPALVSAARENAPLTSA